MEENKFWLSIWSIVVIFLLGCITLGTIASHLERQELVNMVEQGADPMRAACALGIGERNVAICATIALQQVKQTP